MYTPQVTESKKSLDTMQAILVHIICFDFSFFITI